MYYLVSDVHVVWTQTMMISFRNIFLMLTKKTCLELLKVLGSRRQRESLVYIINSTVSTINMIFLGGKTVKEPNPWYIFLQVKGKIAGQSYRCGASLINDRWAVTAAHCLCFEVTIL